MESVLDACKVLLPEHPLQLALPQPRRAADRVLQPPHLRRPARDVPRRAEQLGARTGRRLRARPRRRLRPRPQRDQPPRGAGRRRARGRTTCIDGSGRSVGVIAFNSAQADGDRRGARPAQRVEHPELEPHFTGDRLDAVFVKHLEAVQGDERDVIIFSVGYGYDANGTFPMNFGPLNKRRRPPAPQRRRHPRPRARRGRLLGAAVGLHDRGRRHKHRGPSLLKHYLEYARAARRRPRRRPAGSRSLRLRCLASSRRSRRSSRSWAMRSSPTSAPGRRGSTSACATRTTRPASCSASSPTGATTSACPPAATVTASARRSSRDLGWRIHPIWSIDWVNNRREQVARLTAALTTAAQVRRPEATEPDEEPPRATRCSPPTSRTRSARAANGRSSTSGRTRPRCPGSSIYDCADLIPVELLLRVLGQREPAPAGGDGDRGREHRGADPPRLPRAPPRRRVRRGALHQERRQTAVRRAVQTAERRGALELRGDFVFRRGQRLPPVRTPDPYDDRTRREVGEIHCLELGDRDRQHEQGQPRQLDVEELLPQAARIFGSDRSAPASANACSTASAGSQIELEELRDDDD